MASRMVHGLRAVGRAGLAAMLAAGIVLAPAPVVDAGTIEVGDPPRPEAMAPIPPNGPTQVVVFDRRSRTTTMVSHDQVGQPGGVSSSRPSISSDGSLVAFESEAALVTDDTNGRGDVYLWTGGADRVELISRSAQGGRANGDSRDPSISGDGGVIAFTSIARDMTADTGLDGSTRQVFAWQRSAGGIVLVSVGDEGPGSAPSTAPSVSRDGRVVAFESVATDLVPRDTNAVRDIFLRDLVRGATIRASVGSAGRQVAAESRRPSLSGDGGAVAFDSIAPNLVSGDSNRTRDVFVRDLPPAVLVSPNPLDFGVVPLGTPSSGGVTVVSVGWTPVAMLPSTISGANAADFVVADDACAGQVLGYEASCSIAVLYIPQMTGPRTATLQIADTALDSPQLVSLIGGVPAAEARLDPPVGPAGIVTVLSGTGFPPGALVTFRWDHGISQPASPVVVGPDGTFAVGILVFHNDIGGPRQLLAVPAAGGPSFPDQAVPFLVVPGPLQPPGTGAVTFLAPDIGLPLIRR